MVALVDDFKIIIELIANKNQYDVFWRLYTDKKVVSVLIMQTINCDQKTITINWQRDNWELFDIINLYYQPIKIKAEFLTKSINSYLKLKKMIAEGLNIKAKLNNQEFLIDLTIKNIKSSLYYDNKNG